MQPGVKYLLSQSCEPYIKVQNGPEDFGITGWECIKPNATYNYASFQNSKKTRRHQSSRSKYLVHSIVEESERPENYMTGELDEFFSYTYPKEFSKDAQVNITNHASPSSSLQRPTQLLQYPQPVYLDPVLPYRFANQMDTKARNDLARIISMQLKPEVLIEQIIIENRLRAMSEGNFKYLNLEGVGVDPKAIHDLDKGARVTAGKSQSTPTLAHLQSPHQLQQLHPHRKTKRRKPLEWCTLNSEMVAPHHPVPCPTPNIMETMETMEGRRTELTMKDSVLKIQPPLPSGNMTNFRLPYLSSQGQTSSKHLHMRSTYKQMGANGALEGDSIHVPVVTPFLGAGIGGANGNPEPLWQPNKVKHASKLRSLRH